MSAINQIATLLVLAIVAMNIYTGATIQEVGIPGIISFKFGPKEPVPENPAPVEPTDEISGRFTMDGDMGRIIVISHLSGNQYSVGQPSGAWPWRGALTLDGGRLIGDARSTDTPATFNIDGTILGNGNIDVSYRFITDSNGNTAGGRVDNHLWMRIS